MKNHFDHEKRGHPKNKNAEKFASVLKKSPLSKIRRDQKASLENFKKSSSEKYNNG